MLLMSSQSAKTALGVRTTGIYPANAACSFFSFVSLPNLLPSDPVHLPQWPLHQHQLEM